LIEHIFPQLEQLQSRGVVISPVEEQNDGRYPESKGLFTWIMDLEGNHLELYQPIYMCLESSCSICL